MFIFVYIRNYKKTLANVEKQDFCVATCPCFSQSLTSKIGLRYNNTWNFFTFPEFGNEKNTKNA